MALNVLTKDSLIRAVGGSPAARDDGTQIYNVLNQLTAATPSTGPTFANGLTVTTGGITVTGNSTITGTLGGLSGLTVASGGATITGNSTITGTLGGLTGLTVVSGGLTVTAGGITVSAGQAVFAVAGLRTMQPVTSTHDTTPTAAELTTAFGNPATIGRGFIGTVDDNDGDTNCYIVWSTDASYYFLKGTKAT